MFNHSISNNCCPLWTIDLYCFLRAQAQEEINDFSATMYTQYIGVDLTHYNNIDWYTKTYSDLELCRVKNNFDLAQNRGWDIVQVNNIIVIVIII